MELGLYTFADVNPNPADGRGPEGARRLKHLLEEIELADQVGLDVLASVSITVRIMSCPRPQLCWRQPP
jgi:hypothetical protein